MNEHVAIQSRGKPFSGMVFSVEEIELAWRAFKTRADLMDGMIAALRESFDGERQVDCKLACELVAATAMHVAGRKELGQIEALARSLASTFATHLARRPRP